MPRAVVRHAAALMSLLAVQLAGSSAAATGVCPQFSSVRGAHCVCDQAMECVEPDGNRQLCSVAHARLHPEQTLRGFRHQACPKCRCEKRDRHARAGRRRDHAAQVRVGVRPVGGGDVDPTAAAGPTSDNGTMLSRYMAHTDLSGGDYNKAAATGRHLPPGTDPKVCQAECDAADECVAWTYVVRGEPAGSGDCCLKKMAPTGKEPPLSLCPATNAKTCTSGVKVPTSAPAGCGHHEPVAAVAAAAAGSAALTPRREPQPASWQPTEWRRGATAGPACWADAQAKTYSVFLPRTDAPRSFEAAVRQLPAVDPLAGDCYSSADDNPRPHQDVKVGGNTRVDTGECCCGYWPQIGRIAPSFAAAGTMAGGSCSESFHSVAIAATIQRRATASAAATTRDGEQQCKLAVCLSGAVPDLSQLAASLRSLRESGFFEEVPGACVFVHAGVKDHERMPAGADLDHLMDQHPELRVLELEPWDPETNARVARAMSTCNPGAAAYLAELPKRGNFGMDHGRSSTLFMYRHLWLAHRAARAHAGDGLEFVLRARIDHAWHLRADQWVPEALRVARGGAVAIGAPLNWLPVSRRGGVPMSVRCVVDDQSALGAPGAMDAYASLFPTADDLWRLMALHRRDLLGHFNERILATHLQSRSVRPVEMDFGARIHIASQKAAPAPAPAPAEQHDRYS